MHINLGELNNGVKAQMLEISYYEIEDTELPTILFSKGRQSVEVYWSADYEDIQIQLDPGINYRRRIDDIEDIMDMSHVLQSVAANHQLLKEIYKEQASGH